MRDQEEPALVGNPAYPKIDGRTNHVAPFIVGAGMGIARAAPLALRYGRQGVGLAKRGIGAIKGLFGKNKPFQDQSVQVLFQLGLKRNIYTI